MSYDDDDEASHPSDWRQSLATIDRRRRETRRRILGLLTLLAALGVIAISPGAGRNLPMRFLGYVLAGLVVPCLTVFTTSLWLRDPREPRARRLAVMLLAAANLGFIVLGLWHANYVVRRIL